MLDLTQEKVAVHRLLSDSCEGVEKERPKIIFLLALGADPVMIRVDKILENGSKRAGEEIELELVKKAMRPLLQLISNGCIVFKPHKIHKHMRSLRLYFCCDSNDITGGRDRVYGRFKPEAYATENEGKESQTPTSILMTVTATSGEQVLVKENADVICDDNFFNSSSLGFIQFDRFLPAAMW